MSQEYHRKGSRILREVRTLTSASAKGDSDLWFKINRYVYARLQLDERKIKNKIKAAIGHSVCYLGGKRIKGISKNSKFGFWCQQFQWITNAKFRNAPVFRGALKTFKGSHLRRPDESKGYSLSNAVLTHKNVMKGITSGMNL